MDFIDFNSPFYWAYAFMFLGLAWISFRLFLGVANTQQNIFWQAATLGMTGASCGLALLPFLGRSILGLTNVALMGSVLLCFLILRVWRKPLTGREVRFWSLLMGLVLLTFNALLHFFSFTLQVSFMIVPTAMVMLWGTYQSWMYGRQFPSMSQKFVFTTVLVLFGVLMVWQFTAVTLVDTPQLQNTGDPVYVAVGRLLVVSLIFILMLGLVGIALEKMLKRQISLQEAKNQSDVLNKKMAWTLQERNQMIKVLSFSPQARNAHALISNLAHEINQPLGSIRLYTDHVLHTPDLSDQEKEDVLHKIIISVERAQRSLLDFRMFFPTMKQDSQSVALDLLMREVAEAFSEELAQAQIEFVLDLQTDLRVMGDATQLKMVVLNLLTNAMDALLGHAGQRRVEVRAWKDKDWVYFSIQDSGPGIAPELHEKVFTSYFSTKEMGVGLGLWLCRAIVEYHGGAMHAHLDGKGAKFEFNLPWHEKKDET